jgi:hypothetical protein
MWKVQRSAARLGSIGEDALGARPWRSGEDEGSHCRAWLSSASVYGPPLACAMSSPTARRLAKRSCAVAVSARPLDTRAVYPVTVSDQLKTTRNVAILVAIAAAVYFIPGGGRATSAFEAALWVGFGTAIGVLGLRMYREHRVAFYSLGDRHRGMLYVALALVVFEYAARKHMWETGFGELGWWALVGVTVYCALDVVRQWRSYGGT